MFTAQQYRAKAAEYASYVKAAQSLSESREFQNLERVYRSLAASALAEEEDGDRRQRVQVKGQVARFLHLHKKDSQ